MILQNNIYIFVETNLNIMKVDIPTHTKVQQIMDEYLKRLNDQYEQIIIEGLKRKGFEFEHRFDVIEFLKEDHCRTEQYQNEKTYFVNDIPFLLFIENNEFKQDLTKENTFTMESGSYKFL